MRKVDVCLTPDLIHLHPVKDKIVVIVDILRATSCMVAGLGSGINSIKPFASVEECLKMRDQGYIIAGERGGKKVDGFDIGNSPFSYMEPNLKGKNIAVTTTNGTKAISLSSGAKEILIGAFLNLGALSQYLNQSSEDILIFCAGWKGHVNLEDTLFAGALLSKLKAFEIENDSVRVALSVYKDSSNIYDFIKDAAHAKRLKNFNIEDDIRYCSEIDQFQIVPKLAGDHITV